MINIAFEFINTELNKEHRGKIKPSDFNVVARASVINVTSNILEKMRQVSYRELRGGHGAAFGSQTEFHEQIIEHYLQKQELVKNRTDYLLPNDCRSIAAVHMTNGEEVEKITKIEFHRFINTKTGRPTQCYPVYYRMGDKIYVSPELDKVYATYLRIPKTPKWTYTEVFGVATFDSSQPDFQDLDIPYELFSDFLKEALKLCGLTIRETEISQFIRNEQNLDIQTEQ